MRRRGSSGNGGGVLRMRTTAVEPLILHIPIPAARSPTPPSSPIGELSGPETPTPASRWTATPERTADPLAPIGLITACIRDCYAELLIGEDARDVARLSPA